jgi:hypothetical protein
MTGLEVLLPALLPAATDGVRALINKFTGGSGAKPSNPDDVVKLMEAETKRLKALAELEGGGTTYEWVEAVRKLQRPAYGLLAILSYIYAVNSGDVLPETTAEMAQWVQMFGFYLFGDRTYMYLKKN